MIMGQAVKLNTTAEERRGDAYGSSCCPLRAPFSSVIPRLEEEGLDTS